MFKGTAILYHRKQKSRFYGPLDLIRPPTGFAVLHNAHLLSLTIHLNRSYLTPLCDKKTF